MKSKCQKKNGNGANSFAYIKMNTKRDFISPSDERLLFNSFLAVYILATCNCKNDEREMRMLIEANDGLFMNHACNITHPI